MAAALLRQHFEALGVDVIVGSAGTQATDLPVDPVAVEALAERDVDISQHRPRQLDRRIVDTEGADLVLTMTRAHLRAVATTAPGALPRTFTLREFARRAVVLESKAWQGLDNWLAAAAPNRHASDLMGDDPDDDISDPYGTSLDVHRRCATELDQLTEVVARTLAAI